MARETLQLPQPEDVLYFSQDEVAALVKQWIDVFAISKVGVNTKAYLWHIFSSSRYPSLSGNEAIMEYEKQVASEYIVLSNDRKSAFATKNKPLSSFVFYSDYYVFPANFAWTMAFTHEDGWLGPYFARHVDYVKLNQFNIEKIHKLQQIEQARLKGWS